MTRDLRRFARQTQFRLIVGGILLLLIVGDGLIYYFYGPRAATLGLLCLAAGVTPILVIIVILGVMDWIVRRANRD